ncbi:MAG: hypothetical protein ACRD2M_10940, partial [Terriglobales bacterium]
MSNEKKNRPVVYFRSKSTQSKTLESLMLELFKVAPNAADRLETLVSDDYCRFLNHKDAHASQGLCGALVAYQPGKAPQAFDPKKLNQPEVDMRNLLKQLAPANAREVADTFLYFLVKDNHLVLNQARGLRVDDFEEHVTAMMQKHNVLPASEKLHLEKHFNAQTAPQLRHVQKLTLGSRLIEVRKERILDTKSGKVRNVKVSHLNEGTRDLLARLVGTGLDHIVLDDSVRPEDIQLRLEITVRGRKKDRESAVMEAVCNT